MKYLHCQHHFQHFLCICHCIELNNDHMLLLFLVFDTLIDSYIDWWCVSEEKMRHDVEKEGKVSESVLLWLIISLCILWVHHYFVMCWSYIIGHWLTHPCLCCSNQTFFPSSWVTDESSWSWCCVHHLLTSSGNLTCSLRAGLHGIRFTRWPLPCLLNCKIFKISSVLYSAVLWCVCNSLSWLPAGHPTNLYPTERAQSS